MIRPEWIPSAYSENNIPLIRRATPADLSILKQFEQGVVEAERPFTPCMKAGPANYYDFDKLLSSPDVYLAIAEINGELIASGYAPIDPSKPYLKHAVQAYLGFMYVVPAHRGKGINKLIIDALQQWAKQRNVTELRLEVYTDNVAAIKAYEKFGFKPYLLEMRLGLE